MGRRQPFAALAILMIGIGIGFGLGSRWGHPAALAGPTALSIAPLAWPIEVRSTECVIRLNGEAWNIQAREEAAR